MRRPTCTQLLLLAWIATAAACALHSPAETAAPRPAVVQRNGPLAVLPVNNISGTPADVDAITASLRDAFSAIGWEVLPPEVVESFIFRNRVRYIGGVDEVTAARLREETGARSVLVSDLSLFDVNPPPRMALFCRIVSTAPDLSILWMDGTGRAGNDATGILQIRLIEDPLKLQERIVARLADAAAARFAQPARPPESTVRDAGGYPPRSFYKSPVLTAGEKYRIAVIPFYNSSERKFAGEIMALQFLRSLLATRDLDPVEPGRIRHALLGLRVMMEDGISLANTDILFQRLDVDLILTGRVLDYRDSLGADGVPCVDFSTLVVERRSREVVWSSKSASLGTDTVHLFDWGKEHTAYALASRMVEQVVRLLVSDLVWEGGTQTGEEAEPPPSR